MLIASIILLDLQEDIIFLSDKDISILLRLNVPLMSESLAMRERNEARRDT